MSCISTLNETIFSWPSKNKSFFQVDSEAAAAETVISYMRESMELCWPAAEDEDKTVIQDGQCPR